MDKQEIINNVQRELNEILVHYTVKVTQEQNILLFKIHTEITLDNSQIKKLISLGHISMKRSGKGITTTLRKLVD